MAQLAGNQMDSGKLSSRMANDHQILSFNNIYKNHNGNRVLDNISFCIDTNQITTLVGPNGAGKTTIAKLILGITKPDRGEVIKSKNITLSYLPQKYNINPLLPLRVLDLLALYNPQYVHKDLVKLMNHFAQIDSLKYKQILDLSGGQLQKICIAAAILSTRDLTVLDEPTQSLDYDSEKQFYQLIREVKNNYNITFFIISHDLHMVAKSSDKVICLNNHICCSGDAERFDSIEGEFALYKHQHNHIHK